MSQEIELDKPYLEALTSWIRKKWYNKITNINDEITKDKKKFIFHLKYFIDNINYPEVTFDSHQYDSFKVWKVHPLAKEYIIRSARAPNHPLQLYSCRAVVGPFEDNTKCSYFGMKVKK